MSLQEMNAFENGLGFMGCFKILEYPAKVQVLLENSFAEMFTDPWGDWDKIRRVFDSFGTYRNQENASFSKYEDQGDSQKGPYFMSYHSDGVLVQMYQISAKLGILKDAEDSKITYTVPPTPKEVENLTKWKSLAVQFEKIVDIQTTLFVSAFAIAPLFNQTINQWTVDYWVRSPAQMKLYSSYLMGTGISMSERFGGSTDESCIHRVPWNTTNAVFPDLISTCTGDWWYNLIAELGVDVEYEIVDAPLYEITATDISNDYFDFDNGTDNVVHIEYAIALPEDSTSDVSLELKTCFGITFGQSLLYPCDVCEYASDCGSATYINPALIDYNLDNRLHWGSTSYAGQRIRIQYKKITVV